MKYYLFLLFFFINASFYSIDTIQIPYKLDNSSNIFFKTFLFYFQISDSYESVFLYDSSNYSLEININKNKIKNEPATPNLFETDLFFRIDNIPYDKYGIFDLDVTIRFNRKIRTFRIPFKIYYRKNRLFLKSAIKSLKIKDITNNEYFNKRGDWEFPILFDLYIKSSF